jgi:hypothetical protein
MCHFVYGFVTVAGVEAVVAVVRRRRLLTTNWLAVFRFEAALLGAVLSHSLVSAGLLELH